MIRQKVIDGRTWYSVADLQNKLGQHFDIKTLTSSPDVQFIDGAYYVALDDKQDDFDEALEALLKVPKPEK